MADLAAIEREWPLILAELALLDAEIVALAAGPALSPIDRRRVRRAQRRVLREAADVAGRTRDALPTSVADQLPAPIVATAAGRDVA